MTTNKYAKIQDNWFGTSTKNPVDFKGEVDLTTEMLTTLRGDFDGLAEVGGTLIDFSIIAIPTPKILVIQSDEPITVEFDSSGVLIPCDPLLIITNQSAGTGPTTMVLAPVGAADVTCRVKIRG